MDKSIMTNTSPDDDEFIEAAKKVDERTMKKSSGGSISNEEYQTIKYCDLTKEYQVYRCLGGTPKPVERVTDPKSVDAIEVNQIEICGNLGKDRKAKVSKFIIPDRNISDPNKDHVLWKVYDLLTQFDWVDKKKVARYEHTHPALYNWVTTGGFQGKRATFARGLNPQRLVVQNVIDRSDMAWHRENKKTKILCKSSYQILHDDGTETTAYNLGIPSFGYLNCWSDIWKSYGNWEKYDIAIKRTGVTNPPIRMLNASRYKESGMTEELKPASIIQDISIEKALTEEEKSWERYELSRLFGISTYTKILARLSQKLAEVDEAFGTHFLEEVKSYAAQEKAQWEAEKAANGESEDQFEDNVKSSTPAVDSSNPRVREAVESAVAPAPAKFPPEKMELLRGWDVLKPAEKDAVTDVTTTTDAAGATVIAVTYSKTNNQYPCPKCGVHSPEDFLACPVCGAQFKF